MTQPGSGSSDATGAPPSKARSLLQEVTSELDRFEAKKLAELKSALDAFVKKQEKLVDDYGDLYGGDKGLRQRWCDQQKVIETLYASLKCSFPNQDWKKIVAECICKKERDVACLEQTIARRQRCCRGRLERARAVAEDRFVAAKKRLDALVANATGVDAQLKENAKLIEEIDGLRSKPEKAIALYLFWFKLLPAHKRLMPVDVDPECVGFADEESPEKLCHAEWCTPCPPEPGACAPPKDDEAGEVEYEPRREAPWLVPPDRYEAELFDAWSDYRRTKDDFAAKEAAYKAAPDDLASLGRLAAERRKALEAEIKDCLKKAKADDTCCDKPAAAAN